MFVGSPEEPPVKVLVGSPVGPDIRRMDPTPDQLRNVDSLDSLFTLAELVDPGLRFAVLEGLGGPTTVPELSYVASTDLEAVLDVVLSLIHI